MIDFKWTFKGWVRIAFTCQPWRLRLFLYVVDINVGIAYWHGSKKYFRIQWEWGKWNWAKFVASISHFQPVIPRWTIHFYWKYKRCYMQSVKLMHHVELKPTYEKMFLEAYQTLMDVI